MSKKKREAITDDVAQLFGVSVSYVDMVIRGERNRPDIVKAYNQIVRSKQKAIETIRLRILKKQAKKTIK